MNHHKRQRKQSNPTQKGQGQHPRNKHKTTAKNNEQHPPPKKQKVATEPKHNAHKAARSRRTSDSQQSKKSSKPIPASVQAFNQMNTGTNPPTKTQSSNGGSSTRDSLLASASEQGLRDSALSRKHEAAKQILRILHENNIGYEELLSCDLDAGYLKEIYAEIGIDVEVPTQQSTSISTVQPHMDMEEDLNTIEGPAAEQEASSSFPIPTPAQMPKDSPPPVQDIPVSQQQAPALERKDYIAQMMALKASKASPQENAIPNAVRSHDSPPQPNQQGRDTMTTVRTSPEDLQMQEAAENENTTTNLSSLRENARRAAKAALAARTNQKVRSDAPPVALDVSFASENVNTMGVASNSAEDNAHDENSFTLLEGNRSARSATEEITQPMSVPEPLGFMKGPPGLFMTKPTASQIGSDRGVKEEATDVEMPMLFDPGSDVEMSEDTDRSDMPISADEAVDSIEGNNYNVNGRSLDPSAQYNLDSKNAQPHGHYDGQFIHVTDDGDNPTNTQSAHEDVAVLQGSATVSDSTPSFAALRPPLRQSSSFQHSLSYQQLQIEQMKRQIELAELKKKIKARRTGTPAAAQTNQHEKPMQQSEIIEGRAELQGRAAESEERLRSQVTPSAADAMIKEAQGTSDAPVSLSNDSTVRNLSRTLVDLRNDLGKQPSPSIKTFDFEAAYRSRKSDDISARSQSAASPSLTATDSLWKKQRRAQIESTLGEQQAQSASNLSRLESLKAQMQELEERMRKEEETKNHLVQELESLGIDTENIPEDELQETRDEVVANLELQKKIENAAKDSNDSPKTSPEGFPADPRHSSIIDNSSSGDQAQWYVGNLGQPEDPNADERVPHDDEETPRNFNINSQGSSQVDEDEATNDFDSLGHEQPMEREETNDHDDQSSQEASNVEGHSDRSFDELPTTSFPENESSKTEASATRGELVDDLEASASDDMDMGGSEESEDGGVEANVQHYPQPLNDEPFNDDASIEGDYSPEPPTPLPLNADATVGSHVSISSDEEGEEVDEEYEPPQPDQSYDHVDSYNYDLEDEDYEPPDATYEEPQDDREEDFEDSHVAPSTEVHSYSPQSGLEEGNDEGLVEQPTLQVDDEEDFDEQYVPEDYPDEGFDESDVRDEDHNVDYVHNELNSNGVGGAEDAFENEQHSGESVDLESGELQSESEVISDVYSPSEP